MIIHSLQIIAQHKRYINIPTKLIDELRKNLGLTLAAVWETLYKESNWTDGIFTRSYNYLADKFYVSRRTAMRYIEELIEKGYLTKKSNFSEDNYQLENTYQLELPDEVLESLNNAPNRDQPEIELNPDYSINQEEYDDENNFILNPVIQEHITEVITAIDQRDYLALLRNHKPTIGKASGANLSLKDNRSYYDINNTNKLSTETEPKTAIICCAREEEPRSIQNDQNSRQLNNQCIPKSVPQAVVNKIKKVVASIPGISNPSGLVQEAIHFVANRKEGYSQWTAVGAFRKLLGKDGCGGWSTPWRIKPKESPYGDGYED